MVIQKPIEKKKRSLLSYMEKKELEQLPEKMELLETEIEDLDHQMNECQSDFAKLKELSDLRTQKEEELELVGCGDVAITHDKVWYEGTINGENVYKEFNYNMLVQLPYGVGTHFEIPTQDYTYKFVPTNNLKVVMEWVQLIDIIREIRENDEHSKSNTEE